MTKTIRSNEFNHQMLSRLNKILVIVATIVFSMWSCQKGEIRPYDELILGSWVFNSATVNGESMGPITDIDTMTFTDDGYLIRSCNSVWTYNYELNDNLIITYRDYHMDIYKIERLDQKILWYQNFNYSISKDTLNLLTFEFHYDRIQ
jgi:hypothetical protein